VAALGFGLPMLTRDSAPAPAPAPAQAPPAAAAKPAPPAPIAAPDATGLGASLLKLAVGLAVVCGVCVLAARYLGPKPAAAAGPMEVVASIALAQCVLHLVRAGDRRLLIGTDPAGVKAVLELPHTAPELPPEAAATSSAAPAEPAGGAPLTQEALLALLFRLRAQKGAAPPP
jgi:hypothetical protein